ncbi:MAG: carboxylesterase/lipase family protein [Burkholderiaceae bacterium]|nr:carboxylesterase/lipase family protein [Microbacteriaceae bacterium]
MTGDPLRVRLTSGEVRGIRSGGVRLWRGIPFAAPPVGALRFRGPRPVKAWRGIRVMEEFGPIAPQDRAGPFAGAAPAVERSEDCLTVNVAAPARNLTSLPVMVFIHGGAYSVGAPSGVPGRGENFVRRGVVHVTFTYRLNAFGYVDLSDYGFDSNLGLRDQVAALEWVRDNIAAFGGDPANVTVYGESSGGNAVTTLLATPAAAGLFARAIAQSPPAAAVYPAETTARWAAEFMRILGITPDTAPATAAQALLAAPADDLVRAARLLFARVPDTDPGTQAFCPVVDGEYLPRLPLDAFRDGLTHPVPLLIGTNDREGSIFTGRRTILATTPRRMRGLLQSRPADVAARVLAEYGYPSRRGALDFGGDFAFWIPTLHAADGHSRVAPTHLYRLDAAPRLLRVLGLDATHGLDLLTVFGRTRTTVGRLLGLLGGGAALLGVSKRMQDHWYRFAVDGTVDPAWPAWTPQTRECLVFGGAIRGADRIEADPRASRRKAWTAAGF